MVVKHVEPPLERIREIINSQNGILLTSDLAKYRIPRTYLSVLEQNGEIERISRGVYSSTNSLMDEMVGLQSRYKNAIFSNETALYLLELTDRTPLFYAVTVPSGYNASQLKASGAKVYYVKRDLYALGETIVKSPHGNDVKTYNLERTICDIVRSRNQMDFQLVTEALKRYVGKKERNIDLLYHYARQFRVLNIIKVYIEVLL